MKRSFLIFLLSFAGALKVLGQINSSFSQKIISADTILLVTHRQTEGSIVRDIKTGKYVYADTVVVNGRPNSKVITESKMLSALQRKKLVSILKQPCPDKSIETCKCFVPFHAILVIKDRFASYIEICFACNSFRTSEKNASRDYLDKQKQEGLKRLFAAVGLSPE